MDAAFDRRRLATAVVEERDERDWTQADLARASGLSVTTVQRLELAAGSKAPYPKRPSTFAAVDRAFGWPDKTTYAIAEGTAQRPRTTTPRVAPQSSSADPEDFEQVLRGMSLGEDLRQVLIDAYRRDKAKDDQERREKYLKIARSAKA